MNSNTFPSKLNEAIINQIKDFEHSYNAYDYDLTEEQKSLVDELIQNEELRERYKKYGLCEECNQPCTGKGWCQSCNSKHFQQDFNKWTSGNKEIDEFIQNFQLNATCFMEVLEWIPDDRFENIKYLAEGGFSTVYKAKWIDGFITSWDINQNKWNRTREDVVLKCLNNSQNLATDFLQEVIYYYLLLISCFNKVF
jgi:hypothetical protein